MDTRSSLQDFVQMMQLLQEPAAYPHPVESVHMVQTHISCVFLTGDYAYKVKKPVDFGFLNYSTLEQRRHYCELELHLNRRLCPDIYQEIVPITRDRGRLKIGGSGTPVEWAVQMKQLRAEDMLPLRLRDAAAGSREMERLARRLAAFHENAPGGDDIRAYGAPTVVADTIAVTLQTMDTVSGETQSAEARQALRRHLEAFLRANADLFTQRIQENRIRDCHGDLRTQNICLDARYDGGIQVFDCIEFNDAFRYIDVAADIAYLAMDLDLAGRADLRESLLDTYVREAGDTSLAQILPFYLVYRAIVRGNIALLAGSESEIPEPERQAQRDIAAVAYDLARCYAHRRQRPALLITVGFSGSGKSVLARELARRLPAVYLSSDVVRRELAGMATGVPLETVQYTAARRAEIYEAVRQRAGANLVRGRHVLLDATFLDPQERVATACVARSHEAEFWILECRCSDALIRQRLQARQSVPNASDADLHIYEQQRRAAAESRAPLLPASALCHHVIVDTSLPATEAAHNIVDRFLAA